MERARDWKRRYGIDQREVMALFVAQNGLCPICEERLPEGKHRHIDHDHVTGKVRALVCVNCNFLLGQAGDNPERLRAAASYLERHRD